MQFPVLLSKILKANKNCTNTFERSNKTRGAQKFFGAQIQTWHHLLCCFIWSWQ